GTTGLRNLQLYPLAPHLLWVDASSVVLKNALGALTYGTDFTLVEAGAPTSSHPVPGHAFAPYYEPGTGAVRVGSAVKLSPGVSSSGLSIERYGTWIHAGMDLRDEGDAHAAHGRFETMPYKPNLYDEGY